jgi:hypothetical protein
MSQQEEEEIAPNTNHNFKPIEQKREKYHRKKLAKVKENREENKRKEPVLPKGASGIKGPSTMPQIPKGASGIKGPSEQKKALVLPKSLRDKIKEKENKEEDILSAYL